MRQPILALLASVSLSVTAVGANAATFANGSYSLSFAGITESYDLDPAPGLDPVPGLAATLDFTVSGAGTSNWTFSYTLTNGTDSSIWESSRISGFGFDVLTAGLTGVSVIGTPFDESHFPGGFPSLGGLGGTRDVCINSNHGSCQGGGGDGPATGQNVTGSFTLAFDASHATIELDDGIIRWQSLSSKELGIKGSSGIGLVVSEIPEPATWLTMIAGFGMIGVALRRRSTQVLA